jgi:hypothetical protein
MNCRLSYAQACDRRRYGHDPCSPSPAYPSYATRFVEPGQQLRLPCCRLIYSRLTGKEIEFRPIILGDAINEHDACAANRYFRQASMDYRVRGVQ